MVILRMRLAASLDGTHVRGRARDFHQFDDHYHHALVPIHATSTLVCLINFIKGLSQPRQLRGTVYSVTCQALYNVLPVRVTLRSWSEPVMTS